MHRFIDLVFARWKWGLSFFKNEWRLADYPVRFRRQIADPDDLYQPPRFILHPWNASIVGLWISGHGATKQEALADLEEKFQSWKERRVLRGESIIRPGNEAPVEFASTELIQAHEDLAQDFIERVLGHDWAFISDESSLGDFHTERNNDALVAKVYEVYGVDVADIQSGRIAPILERIASERIR